MKLANMILTAAAIVAVTGVSAFGKEKAKEGTGSNRQVTVYFCGNNVVDPAMEGWSRVLTSDMFSRIGVTVHWRMGIPSRPEAGAIVVEVVTGTPAAFKPGALAYALPYEGVHIRIFGDRINAYSNRREVLAHVMAHEITHILQGEARHSSEGVMKAFWSTGDLALMARMPLSFAQEDVDLIYLGMDKRAAQATGSSVSATLATTAAAVGIAEK